MPLPTSAATDPAARLADVGFRPEQINNAGFQDDWAGRIQQKQREESERRRINEQRAREAQRQAEMQARDAARVADIRARAEAKAKQDAQNDKVRQVSQQTGLKTWRDSQGNIRPQTDAENKPVYDETPWKTKFDKESGQLIDERRRADGATVRQPAAKADLQIDDATGKAAWLDPETRQPVEVGHVDDLAQRQDAIGRAAAEAQAKRRAALVDAQKGAIEGKRMAVDAERSRYEAERLQAQADIDRESAAAKAGDRAAYDRAKAAEARKQAAEVKEKEAQSRIAQHEAQEKDLLASTGDPANGDPVEMRRQKLISEGRDPAKDDVLQGLERQREMQGYKNSQQYAQHVEEERQRQARIEELRSKPPQTAEDIQAQAEEISKEDKDLSEQIAAFDESRKALEARVQSGQAVESQIARERDDLIQKQAELQQRSAAFKQKVMIDHAAAVQVFNERNKDVQKQQVSKLKMKKAGDFLLAEERERLDPLTPPARRRALAERHAKLLAENPEMKTALDNSRRDQNELLRLQSQKDADGKPIPQVFSEGQKPYAMLSDGTFVMHDQAFIPVSKREGWDASGKGAAAMGKGGALAPHWPEVLKQAQAAGDITPELAGRLSKAYSASERVDDADTLARVSESLPFKAWLAKTGRGGNTFAANMDTVAGAGPSTQWGTQDLTRLVREFQATDPTAFEKLTNRVLALPMGAAQMIPATAAGAINLAQNLLVNVPIRLAGGEPIAIDKNPLYNFVSGANESLSMLSDNERLSDDFITQLSQGIGSSIGFGVIGKAAGALGGTARGAALMEGAAARTAAGLNRINAPTLAKVFKASGPITKELATQYGATGGVMLAGMASNADSVYQEARKMGADEGTAEDAAKLAAIVGAAEVVNIMRWADGMNKVAMPKLMQRLATSARGLVEETLQEGGNQLANNVIAKYSYDVERSLLKDVGGAALIGGSSALIMETMMGASQKWAVRSRMKGLKAADSQLQQHNASMREQVNPLVEAASARDFDPAAFAEQYNKDVRELADVAPDLAQELNAMPIRTPEQVQAFRAIRQVLPQERASVAAQADAAAARAALEAVEADPKSYESIDGSASAEAAAMQHRADIVLHGQRERRALLTEKKQVYAHMQAAGDIAALAPELQPRAMAALALSQGASPDRLPAAWNEAIQADLRPDAAGKPILRQEARDFLAQVAPSVAPETTEAQDLADAEQAVKDQQTAAVAQQSTAAVAQQSTAAVAQQSTAAVAQQSTAAVAQQSTAAVAQQPASALAQSTSAVAQQPSSAVAQFTAAAGILPRVRALSQSTKAKDREAHAAMVQAAGGEEALLRIAESVDREVARYASLFSAISVTSGKRGTGGAALSTGDSSLNVLMGDLLSSASLKLLASDPRRARAIIQEEAIHAAMLKVLAPGESANIWASLSPEARDLVAAAYLDKGELAAYKAGKSAVPAEKLGHEFLRMALQDRLPQGVTTEMTDKGMWAQLADVLTRIVDYLRDLHKSIPDVPTRARVEEILADAKRALSRVEGQMPDNSKLAQWRKQNAPKVEAKAAKADPTDPTEQATPAKPAANVPGADKLAAWRKQNAPKVAKAQPAAQREPEAPATMPAPAARTAPAPIPPTAPARQSDAALVAEAARLMQAANPMLEPAAARQMAAQLRRQVGADALPAEVDALRQRAARQKAEVAAAVEEADAAAIVAAVPELAHLDEDAPQAMALGGVAHAVAETAGETSTPAEKAPALLLTLAADAEATATPPDNVTPEMQAEVEQYLDARVQEANDAAKLLMQASPPEARPVTAKLAQELTKTARKTREKARRDIQITNVQEGKHLTAKERAAIAEMLRLNNLHAQVNRKVYKIEAQENGSYAVTITENERDGYGRMQERTNRVTFSTKLAPAKAEAVAQPEQPAPAPAAPAPAAPAPDSGSSYYPNSGIVKPGYIPTQQQQDAKKQEAVGGRDRKDLVRTRNVIRERIAGIERMVEDSVMTFEEWRNQDDDKRRDETDRVAWIQESVKDEASYAQTYQEDARWTQIGRRYEKLTELLERIEARLVEEAAPRRTGLNDGERMVVAAWHADGKPTGIRSYKGQQYLGMLGGIPAALRNVRGLDIHPWVKARLAQRVERGEVTLAELEAEAPPPPAPVQEAPAQAQAEAPPVVDAGKAEKPAKTPKKKAAPASTAPANPTPTNLEARKAAAQTWLERARAAGLGVTAWDGVSKKTKLHEVRLYVKVGSGKDRKDAGYVDFASETPDTTTYLKPEGRAAWERMQAEAQRNSELNAPVTEEDWQAVTDAAQKALTQNADAIRAASDPRQALRDTVKAALAGNERQLRMLMMSSDASTWTKQDYKRIRDFFRRLEDSIDVKRPASATDWREEPVSALADALLPLVQADTAVQNALKNSDAQNARIEVEKAVTRAGMVLSRTTSLSAIDAVSNNKQALTDDLLQRMKPAPTDAESTRLKEGFEEIKAFVNSTGAEPKGDAADVNERRLFTRLQAIRQNPAQREQLLPMDDEGLLAPPMRSPATPTKLLYGIRKGNEAWQEEIITADAAKIDDARKWAEQNGFDRFRVADVQDGNPVEMFADSVRKGSLGEKPAALDTPAPAPDITPRAQEIVSRLGVDPVKLMALMSDPNINEANLNEYGRFDKLEETIDKQKAKAYFEAIEGPLTLFKVNVRAYNLLKDAILSTSPASPTQTETPTNDNRATPGQTPDTPPAGVAGGQATADAGADTGTAGMGTDAGARPAGSVATGGKRPPGQRGSRRDGGNDIGSGERVPGAMAPADDVAAAERVPGAGEGGGGTSQAPAGGTAAESGPGNGDVSGQRNPRPKRSGRDAGASASPAGTVGDIREGRGGELEAPAANDASSVNQQKEAERERVLAESRAKKARDYRIGATEEVAATSDEKRLANNLAALELLRKLAVEGRDEATPDEQAVLAKFTGWGWGKNIFDPQSTKWAAAQARLKDLLSDEDYAEAARSSVNSHYTDKRIISAMWDAVRRMGFTGGRVLEPSVGAGHFMGMQPEDLRVASAWTAVDKDATSARIAKYLYPSADVRHEGFEFTKIPDNSMDMAIGNVPFGSVQPGITEYQKLKLHDYFFAKALDKVKPGGLVVFITSEGTMNKADKSVRDMLASKADLVGAVRLPAKTFQANAGTDVTTDVIVLRKRDGNAAPNFTPQAWLDSVVVGKDMVKDSRTGEMTEQDIRANEYFQAHPEQMIGEHSLGSTRYKAGGYAAQYEGSLADVPALLAEKLGQLPANVVAAPATSLAEAVSQQQAETMAKKGEREEFTVMEGEDGSIYEIRDGVAREPEWMKQRNHGDDFAEPIDEGTAKARMVIARNYLKLREAAKALVTAEARRGADPKELAELRAALNAAYDNFVKLHGTVNREREWMAPAAFLESDPGYSLVSALEDERDVTVKVKAKGKEITKKIKAYEKADIFTKRVQEPPTLPERLDDPDAAAIASQAYLGKINLPVVAKMLGMSEAAATDALLGTGKYFLNPETGTVEDSMRYLSGTVRAKLRAAQAAQEAAATDGERAQWQRNIDNLRERVPADLELTDIRTHPASGWIPAEVKNAYFAERWGVRGVKVQQTDAGQIRVDWPARNAAVNAVDNVAWTVALAGGREFDLKDLLKAMFEGRTPSFTKGVPGTDSTVADVESNQRVADQLARLADDFDQWARSASTQVDVEKITKDGRETLPVHAVIQSRYNEIYRDVVPPKYTGDEYLTHPIPGANPNIKLRPHQRAGISRIVHEGLALLAHGVGSGKTYTQIYAAMELKRTGQCKKPMITVQKATINQFAASARKAFPNARILVATESSMSKRNSPRFLAKLATGNWDLVIVTQEQAGRIPPSESMVRRGFQRELADLQRTLEDARKDNDKQFVNKLESAKMALEAKMAKTLDAVQKKQDKTLLTFDKLGVDAMFVDEAHAYKRAGIYTKKKRVKGIPVEASDRAFTMGMLVDEVQSRTNGRNVVFATGTPITNTTAEAFIMLRYLARPLMEAKKLGYFDAFANAFGRMVTDVETSWSLAQKEVSRFAKFTNGPELLALVRQVFDVAIGNERLGITVPKLKGGEPQMVLVNGGDAMREISEWIADIGKEFENLEGEDKKKYSWVPIVTMQVGAAASVDPRLVDHTLPDDPDSKVNQTVRNVLELWKNPESAAQRKTQMVFCDRSSTVDSSKLQEFLPLRVDGTLSVTGQAEGQQADEKKTKDEDEEVRDAVKAEAENYKKAKFNVYRDIRDKLIAAGVPADEIAVVHDYNTDKRREELWRKVNAGEVRIVLGSTDTMGVGVNAQERLEAMHHIDPPRSMTPAMVEQREGRMLRQGNLNSEPTKEQPNNFGGGVAIFRYGYSNSMDAAIWAMLERKQKFINQLLMDPEKAGREFEDAADAVSVQFAEFVARLMGNPLLLERSKLEMEQKRLKGDREAHENQIVGAKLNLAKGLETASYWRQEIARKMEGARQMKDLRYGLTADTSEAKAAEETLRAKLIGKLFDPNTNSTNVSNDVTSTIYLGGKRVKVSTWLNFFQMKDDIAFQEAWKKAREARLAMKDYSPVLRPDVPAERVMLENLPRIEYRGDFAGYSSVPLVRSDSVSGLLDEVRALTLDAYPGSATQAMHQAQLADAEAAIEALKAKAAEPWANQKRYDEVAARLAAVMEELKAAAKNEKPSRRRETRQAMIDAMLEKANAALASGKGDAANVAKLEAIKRMLGRSSADLESLANDSATPAKKPKHPSGKRVQPKGILPAYPEIEAYYVREDGTLRDARSGARLGHGENLEDAVENASEIIPKTYPRPEQLYEAINNLIKNARSISGGKDVTQYQYPGTGVPYAMQPEAPAPAPYKPAKMRGEDAAMYELIADFKQPSIVRWALQNEWLRGIAKSNARTHFQSMFEQSGIVDAAVANLDHPDQDVALYASALLNDQEKRGGPMERLSNVVYDALSASKDKPALASRAPVDADADFGDIGATLDAFWREFDAEDAGATEAAIGATYGEQRGQYSVGRADLSNSRDAGTNALLRGVDQARMDADAPGVRSWETVHAAAAERIARDPEGETAKLVEMTRNGEGWQDEDVMAAKLLMPKLMRDAVKLRDPAAARKAYENAQLLGHAFRQGGTETARAQAIRQYQSKSPVERAREFLSMKFMTPPRSTRRILDAARSERAIEAERKRNAQETSRLRAEMAAQQAQFAREMATAAKLADVRKAMAQAHNTAMQEMRAKLETLRREAETLRQERSKEAILAQDRETRLARISKRLEEDGVTLEDVFSSEVRVTLDMHSVVENFLKRYSPAERGAIRLYQKGQSMVAIAAQTRIPVARVQQMVNEFQQEFTRRFAKAARAGIKVADLQSRPAALDSKDFDDLLASRAPLSEEEGQAALREMMKAAGMLRDESTGGTDPAKPRKPDLGNHATVRKLTRTAESEEAGFGDMLYEWWMNSILSGPLTHAANIVGNTLNSALDLSLYRGAEALLNEGLLMAGGGSLQGARLGEFGELARGLMPGIVAGWKRGVEAFDVEESTLREHYLGAETENQLSEERRGKGAIKGKFGRVVRLPGRLLAFSDDFSKTAYAHMHAGAIAYRMGKAQGLSGKRMTDFIKRELANPKESAAWAKAVERAEEMAFQSDLRNDKDGGNLVESAGKGIQEFRKEAPIFKWIVPFVGTIYNVFAQGVRKSPLGSAMLLKRALYNRQGMNEDMTRRLAEQVIAWGAFALLYGMAAGDEDDDEKYFVINGTRPWDGAGDAGRALGALADRVGSGAYTLRIGDTTYDYGRLEPLATVLGTTVDLIRATKDARRGGDLGRIGGSLAKGAFNQLMNKTFASGISGIVEAMSDVTKFTDYLANFAASFVPNIVKQPLRNWDDAVRENGAAGAKDDFLWRFAQKAGQSALPIPGRGAVRVDPWGREMRKGGNAATRMLVPLKVNTRPPLELADRALAQWNRKNPAEMYAPGSPSREYKDDYSGEIKVMSEDEYANYATTAGLLASVSLGWLTPDEAANPSEDTIAKIRSAVSRSRTEARKGMF